MCRLNASLTPQRAPRNPSPPPTSCTFIDGVMVSSDSMPRPATNLAFDLRWYRHFLQLIVLIDAALL